MLFLAPSPSNHHELISCRGSHICGSENPIPEGSYSPALELSSNTELSLIFFDVALTQQLMAIYFITEEGQTVFVDYPLEVKHFSQ